MGTRHSTFKFRALIHYIGTSKIMATSISKLSLSLDVAKLQWSYETWCFNQLWPEASLLLKVLNLSIGKKRRNIVDRKSFSWYYLSTKYSYLQNYCNGKYESKASGYKLTYLTNQLFCPEINFIWESSVMVKSKPVSVRHDLIKISIYFSTLLLKCDDAFYALLQKNWICIGK